MTPQLKQEVLTTDQGDIVLQWPSALNPDDLPEFEAWIDLMKGRVKRLVQKRGSVHPKDATKDKE